MFFRMVYKSGQIFPPFCHNPRVWQTDRRTDRILLAIPHLHYMQRGNKMIVQKTHISPEDPNEPISTKLGTAGRLADLITQDNFLAICLRILWGVEFWHFPISRRSPLTWCRCYHATCEPKLQTLPQGPLQSNPISAWTTLSA